jgi:RNA polymerase sigma factor (sigma-70 family)
MPPETMSDYAVCGYSIVEMETKADAQLLRDYAEHGTEAAFAEIVTRHTSLVYSAALRQVAWPESAAEVAQCVFIGLAQGARALSGRLAEDASLAGWLCRSARNVSLNLRRDEFRRHSRERLAMEDLEQNSENTPAWGRLCPVLDDAMSELEEPDHDALVMRFFKNQDLRAVGRALGVSDDTAQKRVSRALEKLRDHLSRRGVTTTAVALSVVLTAHAVHAAPAGLALTISTAAALSGSAIQTSTAIATAKIIAMTTLHKTVMIATLAATVGAGIYEARRASQWQDEAQALQLKQQSLTEQNQRLQKERDDAAARLAAGQHAAAQPPRDLSDLLRLRAEVTKLRGDSRELAQLKSTIESDPTESVAKSWLTRVNQLKGRLQQAPGQSIPELQILSDQDWLNAVKDGKKLETDEEFGKALTGLRTAARDQFAGMLQGALGAYGQANNGRRPTDLAQLQPFFDPPVDASVLERYQISPGGSVIDTASPQYAQDNRFYQIGPNTIEVTSAEENTLQPAIEAYASANSGQQPSDPSQLLPYLKTPAEQSAYQTIIKNASKK